MIDITTNPEPRSLETFSYKNSIISVGAFISSILLGIYGSSALGFVCGFVISIALYLRHVYLNNKANIVI